MTFVSSPIIYELIAMPEGHIPTCLSGDMSAACRPETLTASSKYFFPGRGNHNRGVRDSIAIPNERPRRLAVTARRLGKNSTVLGALSRWTLDMGHDGRAGIGGML